MQYDIEFEDNNLEEADTLMICLAAKSSQRYKLCKTTSISMVSVIIHIQPIWTALGREKHKLYLYSMHSLELTMLESS